MGMRQPPQKAPNQNDPISRLAALEKTVGQLVAANNNAMDVIGKLRERVEVLENELSVAGDPEGVTDVEG